jgi:hypothetical protein
MKFSPVYLWYDDGNFISSSTTERGINMPYILLTALLAVATAPIQTQPSNQAAPQSAPVEKTAVALTKKPPAPSTASGKTTSTAVAASEPVITIHGICPSSAEGKNKAGTTCETVVTRQAFDDVVNGLNAIGPPLLPAQLRGVAEGYATTLLNYEAARKAGVEHNPRYAEVMRLARMRAMSDMYTAAEREKAAKVSLQEIQAYYTDHIAKFEELTLRRITLPRYNSANLKDDEFAARASKVAKDIRERAAKGEDLDALQKEVFDNFGIRNPPSTKMAVVRRGIYAADQEKQLFAMKPGDVTGVVEQPSALIIFKMEGRETPSLEKSKDEIVRILTKEHYEKQQQTRDNSVHIDYNEQYLGATPTSGWMPASQLNISPNDGKPGANPKDAAPKAQPK